MLILVLGGISSGKSAYAARLAGTYGEVTVMATGSSSDPEMEARIEAHRRERPSDWRVIEECHDVSGKAQGVPGCLLIDSVDSWLAARMAAGTEAGMAEELSLLAADRNLIAVSSEVGMALVPLHPLGRAFTDALGHLNQQLAAASDRVYLVVAGLAQPLKQ
ncbi:MAG TPA: bifunctional adenosylcobinamide kinase/adenosylcobinamide-phosphate guanylyltransferase [Candidatus Dormibacteraeota bacterium]|jgi:adenosylcobinamide kinase/adenosylcobinamide-phosphate guanylyltransferase|nr:bifunctional adenosylcobinamide kinase/adenosylcobinamide-phosphate guanylyltransferase [Candidatus Dormibacteraeota bacterium]